MPQPALDAHERFSKRYGKNFHIHIDTRSGIPASIIGHIPVLPGNGKDNHVLPEQVSQALGQTVGVVDAETVSKIITKFVHENQDVLNIDASQAGESRAVRISDNLWQVNVSQEVNGVRVRRSRFSATISHGNVVLLGAERWKNVRINTTPKIKAEEALAAGFEYAGGRLPDDALLRNPTLEIVPTAPLQLQEGDRFRGPFGEGYEHRLVWTFTFKRPAEQGTWEAMVDARTGEVLAFTDTNRYVLSGITGGVYPVTSTEVCPSYACCGVMQENQPMPFADTGLPAPNDFANSAGLFDYTSGTVFTRLFGKYVRVQDGCGALSESVFGSDTLNLGGMNGDHDCFSGGVSYGNTPAARASFYELNRIQEMARGFLPGNSWLISTLTANVNLPVDGWTNNCNAYWDEKTVNFYQSGSGCRNTGEIAAIFDHEWGHGLDYNDGNGYSSPSESYADIAAMYRLQTSCIGSGFFWTRDQGCGQTSDGTGYNANIAQVVSGRCALNCSGVRETDWDQLTNPLHTPDTPQNFVCTRCVTDSSSPDSNGPCGREVHCEAVIDSEAAWDFATRDLQSAPYNYDANTAFIIASKIFYEAAGNIGDWHTCSCSASTSNGCGATNAYMQWLAADDDDGDITNGTPHMTALYNAFNRHGIACTTPAPVRSGCAGGPGDTPSVTASSGNHQVDLSWTAVPAVSKYWVFRTEGVAGCNFGKTRIATVNGSTAYTDRNLANDRQYCYSVIAVGASDACFSPASACVCATPSFAAPGVLQGTVTDAATGSAISTAVVTVTGGYTTATDSSGSYRINGLPAGTYDATVTATGYQPQTVSGLVVTGNEATVRTFSLSPSPTITVQGSVTDGSGHGWPLYARVDIEAPGYRNVVYTDPGTGTYTIDLRRDTVYSFTVSSTGYTTKTRDISPSVGQGSENFVLTAEPLTCAPGYGMLYSETFENGPGGYTVSGVSTWEWGGPQSGPGNAHSGSGAFGTNLAGFYLSEEDGYLTSPIIDLSSNAGQSASLSWWQWLDSEAGYDFAIVEVSNDGGVSWTAVHGPESGVKPAWARQVITLNPAYSVSTFRVRFHFTSDEFVISTGWYIDDITVGSQGGCAPLPGGLLIGNVYDTATMEGVDGATVSDGIGHVTKSFPTPDDPKLQNGFYVLFLPAGVRGVTASTAGYHSGTASVLITNNTITFQDLTITRPLAITTSLLPPASNGIPYEHRLRVTGGVAPHSWSIISGNLPSGIILDTATGTIAGATAVTGTNTFSIRVTDKNGATHDKTFTLTTYPSVTCYQPANGTTVPVDSTVRATFSDAMNPGTIKTGTVSLSLGGAPKSVAVGGSHSVALKKDGTVVAWGSNDDGQAAVPAGLSDVVAIAAGQSHTVALKSDGTVVAWGGGIGGDQFGQSRVPPGLAGVVAISAGDYHTLALKADGTVVAWGRNSEGQTVVPAGLTGVTSIAAGGRHSLAVKSDGTVAAWGWGFGNTSLGQAKVPAGLTDVVAVDAGLYHSVALRKDGTVVGWGDNSYQQIEIPSGLSDIVAISAGYYSTAALKRDGTVLEWGNFNYAIHPPPGLAGVVSMDVANYGLAIKGDGTVVRWGGNLIPAELGTGQIAISGAVTYDAGSKTAVFTPSAPLPDGTTYYATVFGVSSETSLPLAAPVTWSFRTVAFYKIVNASLPFGNTGVEYGQTLVASGGTAPYTWAIVSGSLPPGISLNGTTGALGGSPTSTGSYDFTVQVTDATLAPITKAFTIKVYDPLAITTATLPYAVTGAAYTNTVSATGGLLPFTWSIATGSLPPGVSLNSSTGAISGTPPTAGAYPFTVKVTDGNLSAVTRPLSIDVYDPLTIFTSNLTCTAGIACSHSLTAKGGKAPFIWTIASGGVPVGITLDSAAGVIGGTGGAAGTFPVTLRATDANGNASEKSLTVTVHPALVGRYPATGATVPASTTVRATFSEAINPATVSAGNFTVYAAIGARAIFAGNSQNLVVKVDGTLVAWGYDRSARPIIPPPLSGIAAASAGSDHALALKDDGSVVAWGVDYDGNAIAPPGLNGVTAVGAGSTHSVALRNDGTVFVWGNNRFGQRNVPSGLAEVTAIAVGSDHTVALKNDGAVVAWGRNYYGTTTVPAGLTGVVAIAAGENYSIALKSNGTVVAWGDNYYGQTNVPTGLSGVTAIAAGNNHALALKSDGTVVAWGANWSGQATVPAGLAGVTAIAAGRYHSLALMNDGTLIAWGSNSMTAIPSELTIPAKPVGGTLSYDTATLTATFTPSTNLVDGTTYYARVAGISSQTGRPYPPPTLWSFRAVETRLEALPTALDFGNVKVGTTSTGALTLKNSGQLSVAVTSVTIDGTNSPFSVTPGSCQTLTPTLAAGSSCTLGVTFLPTATGAVPVTLQVASNASANPVLSVPLNGTGIDRFLSITLVGDGSGEVHPSPAPDVNCFSGYCAYPYLPGASVTLLAIPASDSTFTGWGGDCSGTGQCELTMNKGKVVTAEFRRSGDTIPPEVTTFNMPSSSTGLTVPVEAFTATDGVAVTGYVISENPGAPSPNAGGWNATPPTSFSFSSPGHRYAYAWAKDAAGNVSTAAVAVVDISNSNPVDAAPPVITAFTLQSGTTLTAPITSLAVTDNVGVTGYLVSENGTKPLADDSRWVSAQPLSFTFTSSGNKTVCSWAKDAAGNVSDGVCITSVIVTPDQNVDTLLTGWPSDPILVSPSVFSFVSNKPGTAFECGLDSGEFFACTSPVTFGALTNGAHAFSVRAKESAQSVDDTPASYTWTVSVPAVRVENNLYATLSSAYTSSVNGNVLEIKGINFSEAALFDRPVTVTLKGGYDTGFFSRAGDTVIHGSISISRGTVTIENISITQ